MNISKFGRKIAVQSGIGQLMDDLGEALAQKGDVLMLGGGNPARIPHVEQCFRRAMMDVLADRDHFERAVGSYDPPKGDAAFREALSDLLRRDYGWVVGPENIALTNGSQSAFFVLFNLFAGEYPDGTRKQILLPLTPEYIGYADVGLSPDLFTAIKPRIEHIDEHLFKYHIDFDALHLGDNIGAICISRPTNPSGNVLTDEEVQRLGELAAERGIPLIIDNAYGLPFPNIVFTEAKPVWNDNMIVCMSLSKLGLPGVRTGIVIARPEVVEMVARVNAVMSLAPSGVGPAITTGMVRSGEIIRLACDVIRPFYERKASHVLDCIRKQFRGLNFRVHKPEGAFFIWLWLPQSPITSQQLYDRLKSRRVVVVPGHHFFPGLADAWPHTTQCLRISYAQPDSIVESGIQTIAAEVRRACGDHHQ
jgi:valine--pyruvate aminotransferase